MPCARTLLQIVCGLTVAVALAGGCRHKVSKPTPVSVPVPSTDKQASERENMGDLRSRSFAMKDKEAYKFLTGGKAMDLPLREYYRLRGGDPVLIEGYTLVVGLNGTGGHGMPLDVTPDMKNEIAKRIQDYGLTARDLDSGNYAVVKIVSEVPPFSAPGDYLDVTVLATNDGTTSLQGGGILHGMMRPFEDRVDTKTKLSSRVYSLDAVEVRGLLSLEPNGIPRPHFTPDPKMAFIPGGAKVTNLTLMPWLEVLGRPNILEQAEIKPDYPKENRLRRQALVTERAINARFGADTAVIRDTRFGHELALRVPPGGYAANWDHFFTVLGQVKPSDLVDGGVRDVSKAIADLQLQFDPHDLAPEAPPKVREKAQALAARQGTAALRLEAIGPPAHDALVKLLESKSLSADNRLAVGIILATTRAREGFPILQQFSMGSTDLQKVIAMKFMPFYGADAAPFMNRALTDNSGIVRYYGLLGMQMLNERVRDLHSTAMQDSDGHVLFLLEHLEQPGSTVILMKTREQRRIIIFGQNVLLKPLARVEHGPFVIETDAHGRPQITFKAGRLKDQTIEMKGADIITFVKDLKERGITFNDIAAILDKLVADKKIAATIAWLDLRT